MNAVKVKRIIEYEIDVSGLGQRIKDAREADGRTMTDICKDAGVSRQYWYSLEKENILGCVEEETIRKMERALGVDLGVSFEEAEND